MSIPRARLHAVTPPAELELDIEVWLDACHDSRTLPVLQLLDDGSIALDDTDD